MNTQAHYSPHIFCTGDRRAAGAGGCRPIQPVAVGCRVVLTGPAGAGECKRVQTGAGQAGACRCGGPGVAVEAVVVTMVVAAAVATEIAAGAVWVKVATSLVIPKGMRAFFMLI